MQSVERPAADSPVPETRGADVRGALLEAAARILATEGEGAVTVRRLAREVGMSTMPLYSSFSGRDELVRQVVAEGVARLVRRVHDRPALADPLAEIVQLGRIYRENALDNPHLYVATFAGRHPLGFEPGAAQIALTGSDGSDGAGRGPLLGALAATVGRAMDAGLLARADPTLVAAMMTANAHGHLILEIAGFFPAGAGEVAWGRWMRTTLIGLGAPPDQVAAAF